MPVSQSFTPPIIPSPFNTPERNRSNNIIFKNELINVNQEVWIDLIPGNCLVVAAIINTRDSTGKLLFQIEGYFNDVLIFMEDIFELDARIPFLQEHWRDNNDAICCNSIKLSVRISEPFDDAQANFSLYTSEY